MNSSFLNQFNNVYFSNNIISFIVYAIFLLIVLSLYFIGFVFDFTDYTWSLIVVFYLILVYLLRWINGVNLIGIYSLFYLTTIMFLCGRFLSGFLGYSERPIFELDFFIYHLLSNAEKTNLMYYLFLGLIAMELGLYASRLIFKRNFEIYKPLDIKIWPVLIVLLIIVAFQINGLVTRILLAASGGYLELFKESQNASYSFNFMSIITSLMMGSVGVFCILKQKKITAIFIFFLAIYFAIAMISGSRGGFICFLLFLLWYLNDFGTKKINIIKLSLFFVGILIFLNTIFYMITFRSVDHIEQSFFEKILAFFYDQGVTLLVFNESMALDGYPIAQYFQNFIPGSTFVYSLLFGPVTLENKTFITYLNYNLNPEMFSYGFGLGWAFFADAYRYSFGIIFIYIAFISLFCMFLNWLQMNIFRSQLVTVIAASIVIHILFLPRNSLATVFPLIFYVVILYVFYTQFKIRTYEKK